MKTFILIIIIFVAIISVFIVLYGAKKQNDKYNNWSKQCIVDGGVVINTEKHFFMIDMNVLKMENLLTKLTKII
jgi:hypothetical protein